jgi:hypothetical protein
MGGAEKATKNRCHLRLEARKWPARAVKIIPAFTVHRLPGSPSLATIVSLRNLLTTPPLRQEPASRFGEIESQTRSRQLFVNSYPGLMS